VSQPKAVILNDQTFAEGTRQVVMLHVATMGNGAALELPVHIFVGRGDGPRLGIAAMHHGDEVFSLELMRHIRDALVARPLRGSVLLLPLLNPIAFEWGTRNTPIDMMNLNRAFPGNEGGLLTDRIARAIASSVVSQLDVLLDFHSGEAATVIDYTYTESTNTAYGKRVHELACLTESKILWEEEPTGGNLRGYARSRGVLVLEPEIGGASTFEGPWLQQGVRSVERIMTKLGMLDGQLEPPAPKVLVRHGAMLRPSAGGLFLPAVGTDAVGGIVPKGTLLATVVSPQTFEPLDRLTAPYERTALLMIRDRVSRVVPGSPAYILGDATENLMTP
jgi:predicted deacylase